MRAEARIFMHFLKYISSKSLEMILGIYTWNEKFAPMREFFSILSDRWKLDVDVFWQ